MAQYKAKRTGFVIYGEYSNAVEYEYRGMKYEVTFPKAWTMSMTSASIQHRDAQARIDQEIDHPKKTDAKPITLDEIFKEYGWE